MNPQFGGFMSNDPNYMQTWLNFQQQQQIMQQQQFMNYQQFCQIRGLNPNDQNSFYLFYQQNQINNFPPNPPMPLVQPPPPVHPPVQPHQPVQPSNISPNMPPNIPNEPYVHGGNLTPILPRTDQVIKPNNNEIKPNMMNVTLKASSGLTVILAIPGNITVNEMFKRYMDRIGLPYSHLGTSLQFLYDGSKMNVFSNEPVSLALKNYASITVFDQGGVIGAMN